MMQLPPGFIVDEVPEPAALSSAYGSYGAQWKADGGTVVFEQTMELKDTTAPAADYAQVREFFERIAGAESGAVVLIKK